MAGVAACNVADAYLPVFGFHFADANLILFDQECAQRILIGESLAVHLNGITRRRRLIAHVEDLIARPEILTGIAMAPQAPLHLQTLLLIHQRHQVNRAMTSVAADSLGHVDAVIEINEIGKLIDAGPLQRLAGSVAGTNGL